MEFRPCDICGRSTPVEVLRTIGFCPDCEKQLHEEADAEAADADESATDLGERLQLALDKADDELLDSMNGI